jgi:ubiquinone/menaquinone biosynthesis C-methylase UbiE
MTTIPDPASLYTERGESYLRFIRLMLYPRGIRAFFRRSGFLRRNLTFLDAGCGTGVVTLALAEALHQAGYTAGPIRGFDLTPALLERFRQTLAERSIDNIELEQADVLHLRSLPRTWKNFELIVSASMLEYVAREQLGKALAGLHGLLGENGRLLLFVTRRNCLTQLLIGKWWKANSYRRDELCVAFERTGFSRIQFHKFPLLFSHLNVWGYIIEAER